jgi:tetratricopeptide (TPR) repeat protein
LLPSQGNFVLAKEPCEGFMEDIQIMQTRAFQISTFVLVLLAIVCTQIPLLNYLGFEYSVLTVLFAGYISGILTLMFWKQMLPENKSDVWRFIGKSALLSFVLIAIPFLISLANAVFVKNCSLGDGAKLYALIVAPGVFFCISIALCVGILVGRWHKTIFTLLFILILCHIPYVTIFRPQVFAFNPIIGFFPGFTYDETLQVTQRLLTYRLAVAAAAGCLLAGSVWLWQIRQNKKDTIHSARLELPLAELLLVALLAPAVVIVFTLSDRLGFSSSENFIRQKLAGHYATAHFDIVYSAGSIKRERIEQIGRLHEYYFDKLTAELKIHPHEHITSFLYATPEQKGRLIGAMYTDLTKPWLRQMHINLADVESVLRHEMVHVLAAEFGWSPMKIAPNSGLIEGFAMAMGRTAAIEEPLHRAAALVFASHAQPDLASLFTFSGFIRANPSISYTLAGSFCQFLIDSFGIDHFKQLYTTGDFRSTYDRDMTSLLTPWQSSIHRIPLDGSDSTKALYFFRRPSIFGKECARVIANLNAETRDLLNRHEYEKASLSAERSLQLSRTSEAVSLKASALFEMRRFKEYIEFVNAQLRDSTTGYTLLPLHLRLGDASWAMDSIPKATYEYEFMSRLHMNSAYEEACALRMEALKNVQERGELRIYFTYSMEDTVRIARLERLTSPLARYLLAREYAAKERYLESSRLFESVRPMESKTLEFFRLRRLGKVWFELKDYEKAKTVFSQALPLAPNVFLQLDQKEWLDRCE